MMNVIVAEGLVDREYVDGTRSGSRRCVNASRTTPRTGGGELTGVASDEITRLARAYAATRPAAIRVLVGMEHHEHGAAMFRAIAACRRWSVRGASAAAACAT